MPETPTLLEQTTPPPTPTSPAPTEVFTPPPALLNQDGGLVPPKEQTQPTEKPLGAPETYAEFKVEGTVLDKAFLDTITPAFKDMNLSQEQAQKLIELQAGREKSMVEKAQADYSKTIKEWSDQVTAQYGSRLPEVRAEIGRLLTNFPDSIRNPFIEAMNVTGAGNHPGFVNMFYEIAKAAGEGKYVKAGAPSAKPPAPASLADAIYGKTPAQQPRVA